MKLAPIIVFCYNRPWHVEQTLEALSRNVYADESELYIFCDGPKYDATKEQINKIRETRIVVRKKQWCKEVHIVEAERNKGLANSIIDGVSKIIKEYGKVVVLEDDLITSPYFLKYMNEALDYYEKFPSVFCISANRPPVNKMFIPSDYEYDVFVSLRFFSTGWAVWKSRWDNVDWSMSYLDSFMNHPYQIKAFNRGGEDLTPMLQLQRNNKIDSWAIQFCFAQFRHHAVAILPCIPYVDNIGFDGSGTHSGINAIDYRNNVFNAPENPKFVDLLYEDERIVDEFYITCSHCKKQNSILKKMFVGTVNFIRKMKCKC